MNNPSLKPQIDIEGEKEMPGLGSHERLDSAGSGNVEGFSGGEVGT